MSKNYYEILGVEKNATKEQISKAFKKKSLKWHPDRWATGTDEEKKTAEEKFKEINEANSVLSDTEKRKNYDMFGDPNGRSGGFGGFDDFHGFGFNMEDIFGNFHGNFGRKETVNKGNTCYADVSFTLKEAFNGANKEVTYFIKDKCDECNGSGLAHDGKRETCTHCNGSGTIKNVQRNGYMTYVQQSTCPHCNGKGSIITNPCTKCHGTGLKNKDEIANISIPKGISDGMQLIIKEAGDYPPNGDGIRGDLIITFIQEEDDVFTRSGDNIITTLELNLYEALCGIDATVECIDGTKVKFKVPKLTQDGRLFRFGGKGMININNKTLRGDHIINVKYKYPTDINKRQEELLKDFSEIEEEKNN